MSNAPGAPVTVTAVESVAARLSWTVARTHVLPSPMAVTSPWVPTLATPGSSELHVTERPTRITPSAERNVTDSVALVPCTRESAEGSISTVATGTSTTVMSAVSVTPLTVADTVTVPPVPWAVTTPDVLTVATEVSLEAQVIRAVGTAFPFRSAATAVRASVAPGMRVTESGVTVTEVTFWVTETATTRLTESALATTWVEPTFLLSTLPSPDTDATVVSLTV